MSTTGDVYSECRADCSVDCAANPSHPSCVVSCDTDQIKVNNVCCDDVNDDTICDDNCGEDNVCNPMCVNDIDCRKAVCYNNQCALSPTGIYSSIAVCELS